MPAFARLKRTYFLWLFCLVFSPIAPLAQAQSASGPTIEADIGYSMLHLPDVRFSLKKQYLWPSPTIQTFEDHNGALEDGVRFGLGAYSPSFSLNGTQAQIGIKGFYVQFSDSQNNVNCVAPNMVFACGFSLLIDNPGAVGQEIPTDNEIPIDDDGTLIAGSKRNVDHYGAALELRSGPNAFNTPFHLRSGLELRAIDQQTTVIGTLTGNSVFGLSDTLRYDEDLDTKYYGAYVGTTGTINLGNGLSLSLDGDIGVYYTTVKYSGSTTYDNNTPTATLAGSAPSQDLDLSTNKTTVITSLKARLEQNFGAVKIGVFALGEWYSYAPTVRYNDIDRPNVFQGNIDGTHLAEDEAWSFTFGGKVTVALN